MKKYFTIIGSILVLVILVGLALSAYGQNEDSNGSEYPDMPNGTGMFAMLEGKNEVPPVNTNASGVGLFILDTEENTLYYYIEHMDLRGTETESHIHGFAPVGQNAGPIFDLASGKQKEGSWNYPEEYEQKFLDGLTYVNIHSNLYPNGEIRGQIEVIPEQNKN